MIEWLLVRVLTGLQLLMMKKTGLDRRGQHPKHHGCVTCVFTVLDELPEHVRVGVFATPRSFNGVIRFSNGAKTDDREDDVHGMAIKLFDVEGRKILKGEERATTHDFILADNPVFLARSVWHLMQYLRLKHNPERVRQTHPASVGFTKPAPDSPLAATYWSQTPYRLGAKTIRYQATPVKQQDLGSSRSSPDFLRESMVSQLNEGPAVFDFSVQLAPGDGRQASEDPTQLWETETTRVATITIPPQQFDTARRHELGEGLCFTPWHALPEHEPLGQINRARRVVYQASAKRRRQRTGADTGEPRSVDLS